MNKTINQEKVKGDLTQTSEKVKKKGRKRNFEEIVKEFISPYHVSTNKYELESASADLTSLPSYHYKFKKNYLASIIVRPADTESLSQLIEKCWELSLPMTIRAAGTSCFSSATPSKGGVIIDMRRINKIEHIDPEKMTVRVGAGISWLNLIEKLSDYGLAPKAYPTSFKTSCVGGFLATPGKAGIGVPKYGTMADSVISLTLVLPNGKIEYISKDSNGEISLDDIAGTYGIYGAISEVELSLTNLQTSLEIIGYGFSSLQDAIKYYKALMSEIPNKPLFLSISERKFEQYAHINFPKQDWLVWAVFYDDPEVALRSVSVSEGIALNLNGIGVDKSYLKEKWRDISDAEVAIGRTSRNIIFQEYWISNDRLLSFYESYIKRSSKYKFPNAAYTISGEEGWSRVKVFGLSDITRPIEFFTVKAFLHDLAKDAFKQGDSLYTIGIVNTFYLLKYRREVVDQRKILKKKVDPKDLFNSYRIVKARMKHWRISLLFTTAKLLYKIF
ncbi:MAG: FAD-binding oxidoreductase [Candidatus Lokiarchaeota archaeon]|nr:FAD-binding oxidoreductase [Candidatus Lokiarchaeota archaeon]